jgi:uncharacterized cysteine cluster protein YcgN (CxxCxxCC family)
MSDKPFWETKSLTEMSAPEWESLCDGCGRCCVIRFEDEETGDIFPTRASCTLFDEKTCRCSDYENRKATVPDCIKLTPDAIEHLTWMPKTCAYRRLNEGRGLAPWHPLITGDPNSVIEAGISVKGQVFSEDILEDVEDAIDFPAPEFMFDPDEEDEGAAD